MPILIVETEINAPPEICFGLIRAVSPDIATADRAKKIVSGEIVTFEGKFLGIVQRTTFKVVNAEPPLHFTDEMIGGNLKSFQHLHEFFPKGDKTLIRDTLKWRSPYGVFGKIFDLMLLKNYLRRIVLQRNAKLKIEAEKIENA